jgi:hypothetical protein
MDDIWIVGAGVTLLGLWLFLAWLFTQLLPGPDFWVDDKFTQLRDKGH